VARTATELSSRAESAIGAAELMKQAGPWTATVAR
jgi:hypothetical protein